MYTTEFIGRLKKSNVSVDGEKTKERAEKLWKSASGELKAQIIEDSGGMRPSIYRIYRTGVISAKMVIAFAQRLNANPYYLTGETDKNNGYSDEIAESFLRSKGYSTLFDDYAAKPKRRMYKGEIDSENKPEETLIAASTDVNAVDDNVTNEDTVTEEKNKDTFSAPVNIKAEEAASAEENINTDFAPAEAKAESVADLDIDSEDDLAAITEEDMITILHSLFICARVSKKAGERLEKIKHILIY